MARRDAPKLVVFNVGWMREYRGLRGDAIAGGGAYVRRTGVGHEAFNFLPHNGHCYGFVRPTRGGVIRTDRIGAPSADEPAVDVRVVWVAPHPNGGTHVIGWYDHATVHPTWQPAVDRRRNLKGERCGHFVEAAVKNCHLLPVSERDALPVPRRHTGAMGQSNVWFADANVPSVIAFRKRIANLVKNRQTSRSRRRTQDPDLKRKVELAAVSAVTALYQDRGFTVTSVEKENLGWDLNATLGSTRLAIEVKGTRGAFSNVELTPNEYRAMRARWRHYRLCVVSGALEKTPRIRTFVAESGEGPWLDDAGATLHITEMTGARLSLTDSEA